MAKPLTSWLEPSFSQHNLHLVVLGCCLHVSVMKFQDKFASLRQVNSPYSWNRFQIIMLYRLVFDQISTEFCGIFRVFVNFQGISWIYVNFAAPWPHEISEALSVVWLKLLALISNGNANIASISKVISSSILIKQLWFHQKYQCRVSKMGQTHWQH